MKSVDRGDKGYRLSTSSPGRGKRTEMLLILEGSGRGGERQNALSQRERGDAAQYVCNVRVRRGLNVCVSVSHNQGQVACGQFIPVGPTKLDFTGTPPAPSLPLFPSPSLLLPCPPPSPLPSDASFPLSLCALTPRLRCKKDRFPSPVCVSVRLRVHSLASVTGPPSQERLIKVCAALSGRAEGQDNSAFTSNTI